MSLCTEKVYINSATSLVNKITRYDQIITALENRIINSGADNSDVEEYQLDDGQVKIKTIYRDINSIIEAIEKFIKLRNTCLRQLNGSARVLRSSRGFM